MESLNEKITEMCFDGKYKDEEIKNLENEIKQLR
jgi:hypothetical protein